MADDFGLRLGIEGEKAFKDALRDINQSFKVLGSELQLVTSQFDKNDNSVRALTARNEVLNKEIDSQKNKIETLRSALQNASESFGESDRRTRRDNDCAHGNGDGFKYPAELVKPLGSVLC
jgi:phage-related minor tail protein